MSASFPLRSAVVLLVLAGCRDLPTTPSALPPEGGAPEAQGVEVTFSGIGTPSMEVQAAASGAESGGALYSLRPARNADFSGNRTLRLLPLETGWFDVGTRGAGGMRYLWATFRVRNATAEGVAYDTPRRNSVLLAAGKAGTNRTVEGTPFRYAKRADGSRAPASVLRQIRPTGWVEPAPDGSVRSREPDVLQVFTEAEVGPVGASWANYIFPYGFVVRNATSTTTRRLPASPAWTQFDGVTTIAYRVPLQPTAAQDPVMLAVRFLPIDDSEVRLTQSLEEHTPEAVAALQARVASLGATSVTRLAVSDYAGPSRLLCAVRVGGHRWSPTELLTGPASVPRLDPDPADGGLLPLHTSLRATFDGVPGIPTSASFAVSGSQGGRYFLGAAYGGAGTRTVSTPDGGFFAGEVVEVSLTEPLGACPGYVARYTVGGVAASAALAHAPGSPFSATTFVSGVKAADLDRDGRLDLVVFGESVIRVLLGDGTGGFGPGRDAYQGSGFDFDLADLNGDGVLDLALVTGQGAFMLPGNGTGGFTAAAGPILKIPAAAFPPAFTLGDMNGDGRPDLVVSAVPYWGSTTQVWVMLANGAGGFTKAPGAPFRFGSAGKSVFNRVRELADFNGDGALDVLLDSQNFGGPLYVVLGNGRGGLAAARIEAPCPAGCSSTYRWAVREVEIGDLNRDGRADVVVGFDRYEIGVLLGNGDGTFTAAPALRLGDFFGSLRFALGDLNGDGLLDVAVTPWHHALSWSYIKVGLGDGGGGFTWSSARQPSIHSALLLQPVMGDVKGDGRLDVIIHETGRSYTPQISVLLNGP